MPQSRTIQPPNTPRPPNVIPRSLSLLAFAASALGGELYYTGFDNFSTGYDTIAGTDNWLGSSAFSGLKMSGVDAEATHGILGIGNAAFIGGNSSPTPTPAGRSINVRRNVNVDPAALNEEILTFRSLVGIKDSSPSGVVTRRDNFEFAFYNQSLQLLASIQFDNSSIDSTTQSPRRIIYRTQWNTSTSRFDLVNTNAFFLHDTLQQLEIRINFRTNRWSMNLDGISIFADSSFHSGPRTRNLGPIAAQLQIIGSSSTGTPQPGDNYMLFDDWLVRSDSLPVPKPSLARNPSSGAVTLTFAQEAGYSYQIEWSTSLSSWLSNLQGSPFTASVTNDLATFTDSTASAATRRFYRITRSFP